jgi:hypothetical protein
MVGWRWDAHGARVPPFEQAGRWGLSGVEFDQRLETGNPACAPRCLCLFAG